MVMLTLTPWLFSKVTAIMLHHAACAEQMTFTSVDCAKAQGLAKQLPAVNKIPNWVRRENGVNFMGLTL
jgi:hypothetical protein